MNNQSKQALNKINDEIWFDLETTGIGTSPELKRLSKIFSDPTLKNKPIGIWQMATMSGSYNSLMYGKTDIPFEEGTESLAKDYRSKIGTNTEEELVKHFGNLIKEKPGAVLSGYNVGKFDIPVMAQAFERFGMTEELEILKKMTVNDVQLTATKFLDGVITGKAKRKLGLNFSENAQLGTKLENMAEALGVIKRDGENFVFAESGKKFSPHYAPHDVTLTKMVHDTLSDPVTASKRFSMERWISSVDRSNTGKLKTWKSVYLDGIKSEKDPIDLYKEVNVLNADSYTTAPIKVDHIQPIPRKPVSSGLPKVAQETKELVKEIVTSKEAKGLLDSVKRSLPNANNAIKYGLIGGAAYLGYKGFKALSSKEDESSYISASNLGKSEEDILNAIHKRTQDDDSLGEKTALVQGVQIHKAVQEEFGSIADTDSEVPVKDKELGIKGFVDIVLNKDGQKIPIEVKSTTSSEMEELEEPLKEHSSQVNFYAHALNAPGGYVMYVDKDSPKNRKSFYVPYSAGTLIRDVADFRSVLLQNKNTPGVLLSWAKQSEDYWESDLGNIEMPTVEYGNNMSGPKVRDQKTRYSHLFPMGQGSNLNYEENGSRYHRRN